MTTETLHDKIRSEVERRLAIAHEAWLEQKVKLNRRIPPATERHVLHDPADSIRRYTHALKILERHPPCADDACAGSDCHRCVEFMPCEPIRDLAESLGIDTGGQP